MFDGLKEKYSFLAFYILPDASTQGHKEWGGTYYLTELTQKGASASRRLAAGA